MTQIEHNIMKLHTETKKLFENIVYFKIFYANYN